MAQSEDMNGTQGRAGRDERGQFIRGSAAAREAGKKGGENSPGNFRNNPERAREAGRKGGGRSSGASRTVYQ